MYSESLEMTLVPPPAIRLVKIIDREQSISYRCDESNNFVSVFNSLEMLVHLPEHLLDILTILLS